MRARTKALFVVGGVLLAAFLAVSIYGLVQVFRGEGTGHILWERLAEAPPGAGEMGADGFDDRFLGELRNASVGEGSLLLTGSENGFWEDVRAAGGVETHDGCLAVTIEGIPVEFCEGPLI